MNDLRIDPQTGMKSSGWTVAILIALVGLAVLVLHIQLYRPFLADDALISLRYADRLVQGKGLTWNDGERVEGYTNFLWTVSCAALGHLGMDLVDAARVLGIAGMAATIVALLLLFRARTPADSVGALLAVLYFALSGSVAAWAIGGLEQPMEVAFLAWAVVLARPLIETDAPRFLAATLPGIMLGLVCLTRADGLVIAVAATAGLLLARGALRRESFRYALALASLPLLFCAVQFLARRAYYGEWVPNSALAKVAFSAHQLQLGFSYVCAGLLWQSFALPAVVLAVVAARRDRLLRRWLLFVGTIIAGYGAHLVLVGGDIFPARRRFVSLVCLLAIFVGFGARELLNGSSRRRIVSSAVAVALLASFFLAQCLDPSNRIIPRECWAWNGQVVAEFLKKAFGSQQPLMAVDPAGCLPFWTGFPSIDMLGLNDAWLAHHRPTDFGTGRRGHELGNGAYVISRSPDLLVFNRPRGGATPSFRSGREIVELPAFRREYRLVRFVCDPGRKLISEIWVRQEGGKLGVRRYPSGVTVPGYLLCGNAESEAAFDDRGRLGTRCSRRTPAVLRGFVLHGGAYRVECERDGEELEIVLRSSGSDTIRWRLGSGGTFSLGDTAALDISFLPRDRETSHIRSVSFVRLRPDP